MSKYDWTPEMGRMAISADEEDEGLCRKMFIAAMEWFDAHPNSDPQFSPLMADPMGLRVNEDARELWKVLFVAAPHMCSAVTKAVLQHVMYAHTLGWEEYKKHLLDRGEAEERHRKRVEEWKKRVEEEAKAQAELEAELEKEAQQGGTP